MSPVIRANWLLLAIAGLLGFLIYMHSQQQHDYSPITQLDSKGISRILITQENRVLARLQRQENGWKDLVSGNPADQEWINRLLHIARLPSLHRFPAADLDLQAFGLLPPRYQLLLDDQPISFGSIDPVTKLRFVQTGRNIHLISDGYTHYLTPPP